MVNQEYIFKPFWYLYFELLAKCMFLKNLESDQIDIFNFMFVQQYI